MHVIGGLLRLFTLSLSSLVFLFFAHAAQAFGLSPPEVIIDEVLNVNSSVTESVRLQRGVGEVGILFFEVETHGQCDGCIQGADYIVMPEFVDYVEYFFTLAPGQTLSGDYRRYIGFVLVEAVDTSGTVSIRRGITATVTFSVVNAVVSEEVQSSGGGGGGSGGTAQGSSSEFEGDDEVDESEDESEPGTGQPTTDSDSGSASSSATSTSVITEETPPADEPLPTPDAPPATPSVIEPAQTVAVEEIPDAIASVSAVDPRPTSFALGYEPRGIPVVRTCTANGILPLCLSLTWLLILSLITLGYLIYRHRAAKNTIKGLLCLALVLSPQVLLADAIGLSPAKSELLIYQGDILPQEFIISRSNPEQAMVFAITQEGSSLVDLEGQTQLTIPAGQHSQSFAYTLNAAEAELGESEARVHFTLQVPTDTNDSGAVRVQYALVAALHLSVVERPAAPLAIGLEDYPTLIKEVWATHVTTKRASAERGQRVTIFWQLNNSGQNPLTQIPSEVQVSNQNITYYQERLLTAEAVPAGGSLPQTADFLLSSTSPSGRYLVTVKLGTTEATATMWIVQPSLFWNIVIVFGSGLATALILWRWQLARRRRHLPVYDRANNPLAGDGPKVS